MSAAASGLSRLSHLNHHLSGLASIKALKTLDDALNDSQALTALAERFARLHQTLLQSPKFRLIITDAFDWATEAETLRWPSADEQRVPPFTYTPELQPENQVWTTNTRVNFCAKAFPTTTAG